MTIEYRGRNKKEDRDHCEAWLTYNENSPKEEVQANKICEIIEKGGWEVYSEYGWIVIRVFDKTDYKDLMEVYKKAKKETRKELDK